VLEQSYVRLLNCYAHWQRRDETLTGNVTIEFVIDADGSVAQARDAGSELPRMVPCVKTYVSSVRFSPTANGEPIVVTFPIRFGR